MVSLTNEQRGKELLATRDAALNNCPSSLCGPPGCPSEIREENMPTPKQNGTSAPLIHPEPSRKKTIEANFHPVLFMIPCSTFWEPSPYPEAPGDEIFVVSPHL